MSHLGIAYPRLLIRSHARAAVSVCKVLAARAMWYTVHRRGTVRPNIHVPNTEVKSELPRAREIMVRCCVMGRYMDRMGFVWLCSLQDDIGILRTILVCSCGLRIRCMVWWCFRTLMPHSICAHVVFGTRAVLRTACRKNSA